MALQSQLDPERIAIRQPLDFGGFKGRYRASVIKPDVLVELLRQGSLEVMARTFGFGSVDHADRSFQPRLSKGLRSA